MYTPIINLCKYNKSMRFYRNGVSCFFIKTIDPQGFNMKGYITTSGKITLHNCNIIENPNDIESVIIRD